MRSLANVNEGVSQQTPVKNESYWRDKNTPKRYDALKGNVQVDVAVIGGGIAGLVTGYKLKQAGYRVAVVEKDLLASGSTGATTGKVSTQHGLWYDSLLQRFGAQKAQTYADMHQQGLEDMRKLIEQEKIDCAWQECNSYLYTSDERKVEKYRREAEAAKQLGLPASFELPTELPFETKAGVKFTNQAKFDAVAFTQSLARRIHGEGSIVFEQSRVWKIRGRSERRVITKEGEIRASHVVVATRIPFAPLLARLSYALVEYPHMSYLTAYKVSASLRDVYISTDKHHHSLLGTDEYLLVGGERHIPGLGRKRKRFRTLEQYAKTHFDVLSFENQWREMDYLAYDKLPVTGPLYPWSKNIYAITGFKKWGLGASAVSAQIILDLIEGRKTEATELANPHRLQALLSVPRAVADYFRRA